MQSGVLSIDIGTSSLKAALITDDGTVLQFTRLFFPPQVSAADWVRCLFSAWHTVANGFHVQAICISGNGPSLVAVHRQRSAVSKASGNGAVPPTAVCNDIIQEAEKDTLFLWNEKAGAHAQKPHIPAAASLFLPRIAAFRTAYPHVFSCAHHLFSGPEYILYLLTGKAVTVLPDPRYESAYWTVRELTFYAEKVLGIDTETLARLLPPFVWAGTVQGQFCGIPVIAGVPDFIAALIGTGTLSAGAACDRAGSSEGINVCTETQPRMGGTLLLPSVIPDLWNVSFVLPDSGTRFSAFLTENGLSNQDYSIGMERIAAEPFVRTGAYPATFAGKGRSLVEDLAFQVRRGCDLVERASGMHPVYTLSGGQARNELWCQMKADMTGRTFALPRFADAELLGNAALAFCALQSGQSGAGSIQAGSGASNTGCLAATVRQLLHIERYYEPCAAYASRYTEKYLQIYPPHGTGATAAIGRPYG